MAKTLVVVAHGIGNATQDFYKEWEKVIAKSCDLGEITVKGLWWLFTYVDGLAEPVAIAVFGSSFTVFPVKSMLPPPYALSSMKRSTFFSESR